MGDMLRYWVGFNLVQGIGPVRIKALREAFGDLEKAWHASAADLKETGLDSRSIEALIGVRNRVDLEAELNRLEQQGFSAVCVEGENYPLRLRDLIQPPPLIYIWGELKARDQWAVGIVGTRTPSAYGRAVTQEISAVLAQQGLTIVSGLARGIDGIAHRSALEAGGRTIAVLGSGLERIYPPEHRRLAKNIVEQGAVISEYSLETPPEGKNFPPRNRIISGLSLGVIVVEAGRTSGALITADFAADQGRDVFAVPGDINRTQSKGTNRLIAQGAFPLSDPMDVLEVLNLAEVEQDVQLELDLPANPAERKLLETLGRQPLHVDEIRSRSALTASEVSAGLAMLEIKGRVKQVGGMHFIRVREKGADYQVD
ncbi:MAG: DNA-processing protein DprA [Anaerolineales bacterium]|jgi:DNA processing protein